MPYINWLTLYYELDLLTFNDCFTYLGLTQVKVCVNKDGHHFYTHISERKKEDKLKDFDIFSKQGLCCKTISIACIKCTKISTLLIVLPNPAANGVKPDCEPEKCGSFHAVLVSGIQLSCSQSKPTKTRGQTLQPPVPNAIGTDQPLQEQVIRQYNNEEEENTTGTGN